MKHCRSSLCMLMLVAAVAFATCYFGNRIWHGGHGTDGHRMLHEQLKLTSAQDKQIEQMEKSFHTRKIELEGTIQQANAELGKAIMDDKGYSKRVKSAVDTIHQAQGELQKATLEHLFDMQKVLTPEQSDKLNRMAADALIHNQ